MYKNIVISNDIQDFQFFVDLSLHNTEYAFAIISSTAKYRLIFLTYLKSELSKLFSTTKHVSCAI